MHVVTPSPGHRSDQTVCRPALIAELAHPDRSDGSESDVVVKVFSPAGDRYLTAPHDEVEMKPGSWHWPSLVQ